MINQSTNGDRLLYRKAQGLTMPLHDFDSIPNCTSFLLAYHAVPFAIDSLPAIKMN